MGSEGKKKLFVAPKISFHLIQYQSVSKILILENKKMSNCCCSFYFQTENVLCLISRIRRALLGWTEFSFYWLYNTRAQFAYFQGCQCIFFSCLQWNPNSKKNLKHKKANFNFFLSPLMLSVIQTNPVVEQLTYMHFFFQNHRSYWKVLKLKRSGYLE